MPTSESYVLKALLSFILYYFGLYFAGLITNIIFLNSAKAYKKRTGIRPDGFYLLKIILWVHFTIPLILITLFILFMMGVSFF